jgi:FAD:protein FMN transferase
VPSLAIAHLSLLLLSAAPAPPAAEAIQLAADAFGRRAVLVVAGLPRAAADRDLADGLATLREVAALTAPDGDAAGGLGRLNAAAGAGKVAVDPRLAELLERAVNFCLWSEGAISPTGGRLYEYWAGPDAPGAPPAPQDLAAAVAGSGCNALRVDRGAGVAELAAGGRLDLRSFAPGFAVDRAVETLLAKGAPSGLVEVGNVRRGFGAGLEGRGWRVALPLFPGQKEPLEAVWLLDRSLAIAAAAEGPFVDFRHGRPAEGVVAALAATELAVDAQALAATMFVTGSRDGQLRLGNLRPRPSILWLLGTGTGTPLLVDYRWGEVGR